METALKHTNIFTLEEIFFDKHKNGTMANMLKFKKNAAITKTVDFTPEFLR